MVSESIAKTLQKHCENATFVPYFVLALILICEGCAPLCSLRMLLGIQRTIFKTPRVPLLPICKNKTCLMRCIINKINTLLIQIFCINNLFINSTRVRIKQFSSSGFIYFIHLSFSRVCLNLMLLYHTVSLNNISIRASALNCRDINDAKRIGCQCRCTH